MQQIKFDWARQWRTDMNMSDKQGDAAIAAVKRKMPSEAQTRYNQRDIKKRRERRKLK